MLEVGGGQVVGERDQPVAGQQDLVRVLVDEDVDDRLGCSPTDGAGCCPAEDLLQRVEAALRIGPGEKRRRRVGAVQFGADVDVLAELGFDEPIEDAEHLGGGHR